MPSGELSRSRSREPIMPARREPVGVRRALRESAWVLVAALALTVFSTWPLAARFSTAGRVDSGDGRYSIWNVAWVAHALTTSPTSLYHANIFYPSQYALAFSEPNILAGVIATPAWLATRNPIVASNWVTIWAFLLSALASYWLARHLTGSRVAGAVTAIFFAISPYVLSHLTHVQLLMTFGMPCSLLAMHRFLESMTARRAVWLGLALGCQSLACGYYAIFAALAVAWGFLWFGLLDGLWKRAHFYLGMVLVTALTTLLVAPFLAPFSIIEQAGFARTLYDATLFAATWRDYLASPMVVYRWMLPYLGSWNEVLFPGFLSTAMALLTVYRATPVGRRGTTRPRVRPAVVGFYVTLAGWAFWASLGPSGGLYLVMHETLPFFSLIRASARFGVLVTLAVAVLAGMALTELAQTPGRRRTVFLVLLFAIAVLRSWAGPLDLFDRPQTSIAGRRLEQLPMGVVAEFPFFSSAGERHRHTEYMLASTSHWKPLVNGYSDHTPPQAFAEMPVLETFPSEPSWAILRRLGVRYVVMHWNKYQPGKSPHVDVRSQEIGRTLRTIVDRDDVSLFEVIAP
jgi:hypothetical protein